MGSKGQNSTFSEHDHVVYQIKGNHKCSNMEAIILPADIPEPGDGVKRSKLVLEHGHVVIKLKGNHECS